MSRLCRSNLAESQLTLTRRVAAAAEFEPQIILTLQTALSTVSIIWFLFLSSRRGIVNKVQTLNI